MSVEAIVALIESESAAEARGLVAGAEVEVRARVAEAEAAAARQVEEACRKAEPAIRGEALRRVNGVRLKLRDRRATLAVERTDAVFKVAGRALEDIASAREPPTAARWTGSLRRLAIDCLASCGPGAVLTIRDPDAAALATLAVETGARLERLPADAPPGVMARSGDGFVEVDARPGTRLARAALMLADDVARIVGREAPAP